MDMTRSCPLYQPGTDLQKVFVVSGCPTKKNYMGSSSLLSWLVLLKNRSHKATNAKMDRILGNLYVSSYMHVLANRVECEEANITHMVAVFKGQFPPSFNKYVMQTIPVDDMESTNIIEYFDDACSFINKAIFPDEDSVQRGIKRAHATGVLIMCQAGESRAPTIMAAYLMKKYNLTPEQALHAIKRKRPDVHPNDSFKEQLELYHALGCELNKDEPQYKQWLLQHTMLTDPTGATLLADDSIFQKNTQNTDEGSNLRCKRCRQQLAHSLSFVEHIAPGEDSKQSKFVRKVPNSKRVISVQLASDTCSHFFVEPLEWMKEELQNTTELEGKFSCPKCDTRVGGYNWKGSRCSCGKWMVPAIYLQKAKVDEVKVNHTPQNVQYANRQ